MNQMLIAAQQMNDQPLKSYPNIIPVPVDANQRILPISNNPLVNFEKHQPHKPQDLDLNFDEINAMLQNDNEAKEGPELSFQEEAEDHGDERLQLQG